jgi:putative membrane protein
MVALIFSATGEFRMPDLDLVLAIGHHLLIFVLFGILAGELALIRPLLTANALHRAASLDLWYGVVALAVVAVCFSRAIFAAKGWAYYSANFFFWGKVSAFVIVALLSILPTVQLIRWRKRLRGGGPLPSDEEIASARRILWAEAAFFALIPIFAAAMARGYGMLQ